MPDEKPLFIPLRREYFNAIEAGEKDEEYRKPGGPWNERTCCPGRAVTLSLGYGKRSRLAARVRHFRDVKVDSLPASVQADIRAIYGAIPVVVGIGLDLGG